jgi:hypothetical protein
MTTQSKTDTSDLDPLTGEMISRRKPAEQRDPERLTPDLDAGGFALEKPEYWWVGVLPDCPLQGVDLGGINFNRLTELVGEFGGETTRSARAGAIVKVTPRKRAAILASLQRTVIRFHPMPSEADEKTWVPRGHLISIPTREENELRAKNGRASRPTYVPRPTDRPVAQFIFAVRCDQENPQPGTNYPPCVLETGLPQLE